MSFLYSLTFAFSNIGNTSPPLPLFTLSLGNIDSYPPLIHVHYVLKIID